MRLWPRSLKWRTILLTLIALVAVVGTVLYQWGWTIQRYVADQLNVALFDRNSSSPVTRGLARGEIRAGQSVDELIATHPPTDVTRHGRFMTVQYGDAPCDRILLRAMDGKLVRAVNAGWGPAIVYFNTLSPEENEEYEASLSSHFDRRVEERTLHRAVGGVAGYEATLKAP